MPTTRKPEVIVREIEQTRAELADTIDAITDRINPKRAASRGAKAVREQVSGIRDRVGSDASDGSPEAGDQAGGIVPTGVRPAVIAVAAIVAVFGLMLVRKRR